MSEPYSDPITSSDGSLSPSDTHSAGSILAAGRRAAGLSIAEVSSKLKLSQRQIEALEADRYADLPGNTFVKGFARNYARLLNIDPQTMLAYLERHLPSEAPQAALPRLSDEALPLKRAGAGVAMSVAAPWLAGALVLGLVLAAAYMVLVPGAAEPGSQLAPDKVVESVPDESSPTLPVLQDVPPVQGAAEPPQSPQPQPALSSLPPVPVSSAPVAITPTAPDPTHVPVPAKPEPPSPAVLAAPTPALPSLPVGPVGAGAVNGPPAAVKPQPQPAPAPLPVLAAKSVPAVAMNPSPTASVPVPAPVTPTVPLAPVAAAEAGELRLIARQESWMSVTDATGKRLVSSLVKPGEVRTVSGQPPYKLRIGNAQHVDVVYKGRPTDLKPHTRVDVADFVLN